MSIAPSKGRRRKATLDVQITYKVPKPIASQLDKRGEDRESRHVVARRLMEEALRKSDADLADLVTSAVREAASDELNKLAARLAAIEAQQNANQRTLDGIRMLVSEARGDIRTACCALLVLGGKTHEAAESWVKANLSPRAGPP
jgi:hypothetical protein